MGTASIKVLTWNILHGGGPTRTPEVLLSLVGHDADVVVLIEFRRGRGGQFRGALADRGWAHQATSGPAEGQNGILVASRTPLAPGEAAPPDLVSARRYLEVVLPAAGMRLCAAHVPDDTQRAAKTRYWRFLLNLAERRRTEKCLIVGDFNSGRRGQDTGGAPLGCEALLGQFCTLGFRDSWRVLNPSGRENSWSDRCGSACRIDCAFTSPALAPALQHAVYSHVERERGYSDHSPLLVTLAVPAPHDSPAVNGLFGPADGCQRTSPRAG